MKGIKNKKTRLSENLPIFQIVQSTNKTKSKTCKKRQAIKEKNK